MKKLFLSYVPVLISALLLTGNASAQNVAAAGLKSIPVELSNASLSSPATTGVSDVKDINTKAVKYFNRNFKKATGVTWYKDGRLIEASFTENGKRTSVIYFPNGRWLHTLIRYDEAHLDDQIKFDVKLKFPQYDIKHVVEVHEGQMLAYFIMIDGKKDFKQVIVYGDQTWAHKTYKKPS